MPTGYTAKLMDEGQPFRDFVMGCARAMGALVTMRDDPSDAEIPERFECSKYYPKAEQEARARVALLEGMSDTERVAFGEQQRDAELARHREVVAEAEKANARLEAMADEVRTWVPPTTDHIGLRDFMIEQLYISAATDTYTPRRVAVLEAMTPVALWEEALTGAREHLECATKGLREEAERIAGRNEWVAKLRASLEGE